MLTGSSKEAKRFNFAAASPTALESRSSSKMVQGQPGGPIPPVAYWTTSHIRGATPPNNAGECFLCSVGNRVSPEKTEKPDSVTSPRLVVGLCRRRIDRSIRNDCFSEICPRRGSWTEAPLRRIEVPSPRDLRPAPADVFTMERRHEKHARRGPVALAHTARQPVQFRPAPLYTIKSGCRLAVRTPRPAPKDQADKSDVGSPVGSGCDGTGRSQFRRNHAPVISRPLGSATGGRRAAAADSANGRSATIAFLESSTLLPVVQVEGEREGRLGERPSFRLASRNRMVAPAAMRYTGWKSPARFRPEEMPAFISIPLNWIPMVVSPPFLHCPRRGSWTETTPHHGGNAPGALRP